MVLVEVDEQKRRPALELFDHGVEPHAIDLEAVLHWPFENTRREALVEGRRRRHRTHCALRSLARRRGFDLELAAEAALVQEAKVEGAAPRMHVYAVPTRALEAELLGAHNLRRLGANPNPAAERKQQRDDHARREQQGDDQRSAVQRILHVLRQLSASSISERSRRAASCSELEEITCARFAFELRAPRAARL